MSKASPAEAPRRRAKAGVPGRRHRKKQRTRREIHGAAMALFAERGFEAVTLDQICEAADVARGTFFLHFPSKGALLRELERELADELAGRSFAEPRDSALAEYRTLVERLLGDWPRRRGLRADLLAAMLREGLVPSHPADAEVQPGLRELVEGVVRRGQQRGELRRGVAPALAATLFLATAAALLTSGASSESGSDAGNDAPAPGARAELLRVLLHGLAEGKPRLKWSAPRRE